MVSFEVALTYKTVLDENSLGVIWQMVAGMEFYETLCYSREPFGFYIDPDDMDEPGVLHEAVQEMYHYAFEIIEQCMRLLYDQTGTGVDAWDEKISVDCMTVYLELFRDDFYDHNEYLECAEDGLSYSDWFWKNSDDSNSPYKQRLDQYWNEPGKKWKKRAIQTAIARAILDPRLGRKTPSPWTPAMLNYVVCCVPPSSLETLVIRSFRAHWEAKAYELTVKRRWMDLVPIFIYKGSVGEEPELLCSV